MAGVAKRGANRVPKSLKNDDRECKFCIIVIMEGRRHYVQSVGHGSYVSRKAEACFFSKSELKHAMASVIKQNPGFHVFSEGWSERVLTRTPEITPGDGYQIEVVTINTPWSSKLF